MTVIRVDPASVRGYGTDAQAKFEGIRTELQTLVNAVTEVRYFGPNAVDFKTQAGQMAADFANGVSQDLGSIAEAVRVITTNIASSLGGAGVSIAVNGSPINPPAVTAVDYVDVDTTALEALTSTASKHFATIDDLFDSHFSKLQSTDWVGNAKDQAVQQVQEFTSMAKSKSAEARESLVQYINNQLAAVRDADRVN